MLSNIERTVDSAHRRALFPDEFAQQFETVSAGSGQAESIVQVAFQQMALIRPVPRELKFEPLTWQYIAPL